MSYEEIIFYVEYTTVGGDIILHRLWWNDMDDEKHQIALYNYLAWEHVKGSRFEANAPSWQARCSLNDGVCYSPRDNEPPDNEKMLESGAPAGPGSFGIWKVVRVEFVSGGQERFRFLVRYHRNDNSTPRFWLEWKDMSSTIAHSTAVWFWLRNDIETRAGFVDCVRPKAVKRHGLASVAAAARDEN